MYELTTRGEQELLRYKDASPDELRLTRRTLMYPVLEAISEGRDTSFSNLLLSSGLSRYEMTGTLRSLMRLGYISRLPPVGGTTQEERRSYYMYLVGQARGKKPESRTKEQMQEGTAHMMERYPEVAERRLTDWKLQGSKRWEERKAGSTSAYREELKKSKPETKTRRYKLGERQKLVEKLRSEGLSESEIGGLVGLSQSSISRLLLRGKPKFMWLNRRDRK